MLISNLHAGNLLENKELLDSLNETKAKSSTITASLTHSKELQVSQDSQTFQHNRSPQCVPAQIYVVCLSQEGQPMNNSINHVCAAAHTTHMLIQNNDDTG